jgi:IS5 family transposase
MKQINVFDESKRQEKLSKLGDPLERLNGIINWDIFKPILNRVFRKEHEGAGGRPPYSYVMLFKILILQRLFNISDDQTEYQINDRMTFMRFLGLGLGDSVPDAKTIWLFRDTLVKAGVEREMFDVFESQLKAQGIITHKGQIVDASFVDAPRQRNTREENQQIKEGQIPEEWKAPENIHKLQQKDTDARWAKKNDEVHYGYKDHVKVDVESKIITDYAVTSANVHDSQALIALLDEKTDTHLYADSAYSGRGIAKEIPEGIKNHIHEKGYRSHPLSEEQRKSNREKSRVRARIEHVFGYMTGSMHGLTVRSIGLARAVFNIGLTNLIYNMCRYEHLCRKRSVTA